MKIYLLTFLALLALVGLPFALKPEFSSDPSRAKNRDDVLTIATPHNEAIRAEFTEAFRQYVQDQEDREVFIEWRVPGGTAEIEKMLETEFMFSFRHHWTEELKHPWTSEVEANFNNARVAPATAGEAPLPALAKRAFLDSQVGSGIDLLFGGGAYAFILQANKGHLVDSGLFAEHPDWASEDILPHEVGGEIFRDKENRWIGACLSTFGICYNLDSLRPLGLSPEGLGWHFLADPRIFGSVGLADPTKSATVVKAFEMILQQEMRSAVEAEGKSSPESLANGWLSGLRLIQRMAGNARYFTLYSSKVPSDVAHGDVAAGMCIDYYGRTYDEQLRQANGHSRLRFFTPPSGSSTSVDPIAMLRGAPNPRLAKLFLEFVFSQRGQKLWNYRAGEPEGPRRQSLRRLPIRRDLYQPSFTAHFADAEVNPYQETGGFRYEAEWTAKAFDAMRLVFASACVDSHEELRAAWKALIDNDWPPEALAAFQDFSAVTYDKATTEIPAIMRESKQAQAAYRLHLTRGFQANYRKALALARAKQ